MDKINQQISNAQESLNNMNPNDMFSQTEYDNLGASLVRIKASHNNNKFYYILQYKLDNILNIISWDDEAEEVLIDSFEIFDGERLKSTLSFVSNSLTKEDVIDKEDGYLE